jgi:hypothetical protein
LTLSRLPRVATPMMSKLWPARSVATPPPPCRRRSFPRRGIEEEAQQALSDPLGGEEALAVDPVALVGRKGSLPTQQARSGDRRLPAGLFASRGLAGLLRAPGSEERRPAPLQSREGRARQQRKDPTPKMTNAIQHRWSRGCSLRAGGFPALASVPGVLQFPELLLEELVGGLVGEGHLEVRSAESGSLRSMSARAREKKRPVGRRPR